MNESANEQKTPLLLKEGWLRQRSASAIARSQEKAQTGWFLQAQIILTTPPARKARRHPSFKRRGFSFVCRFVHSFYDLQSGVFSPLNSDSVRNASLFTAGDSSMSSKLRTRPVARVSRDSWICRKPCNRTSANGCFRI